MPKSFEFMVLVVVLCIAGPVLAQDEGPRLETGQGEDDSDYQLSGPESLATPAELLGGGGDDEYADDEDVDDEDTGDEDTGEAADDEDTDDDTDDEASSVSLELDLDDGAEEGELPPVHAVTPEEQERLRWFLIPPYYQGVRGEEGVRLFFPFFFQRWSLEGQRELAVLPFYYQSRGPTAASAVDVAFPLVYYIRNPERRTLVVANVWWSSSEDSSHAGFFPLLAWGHTAELSYQIGFPLFYRFRWSEQREFWLAGPVFNHRFESGYRRGLFPLFWAVENHGRGTMVGFPIFWRFWNRSEGSSLTVVPPVYAQRWQDGYGFGIAPLLFVRNRADRLRLTVFPLFHYRSDAEGGRTFVSPVAWYHRDEATRMGGVLLYHWMRGPHSRFDGLIPLYLSGSDSRDGSRWRYIFPFAFTSSSPVRRATVLFPAVWDFEERHRTRTTVVLPFMVHHRHLYEDVHTTWVLPTFQYSRRTDGWDFNVHPLLYLSESDSGDSSHQVFFPLFWRFHRPDSTHTVAFPLWWDFQDGGNRFQSFFPFYFRSSTPDSQWTSVLNVVYSSGRRNGVPFWSLNIFPIFRVGRPAPSDIDWQVLLGLFGYGRRGSREWVDLFWVPVEYGEGRPEAEVEAGAAGDAEGEGAEEEVEPSAPAEPADVSRQQDVRPGPTEALPHLERRG